jgi:hypothetical protein
MLPLSKRGAADCRMRADVTPHLLVFLFPLLAVRSAAASASRWPDRNVACQLPRERST